MKQSDLKNIIISFERAKNSEITGFDFLKNPPEVQGGGLQDQVVTIQEELSYADLIESFFEASETLSPIIGEASSYVLGAIFSLVWNSSSISLFPDEYKEILDLIQETDDGNIINQNKLNELIKQDNEVKTIIEELINQKIIRKKKDGNYVVRKKILTNSNISFIQIANKF